MDLRQFYLDNVSQEEYYYHFYKLIQNINDVKYEEFTGLPIFSDYDFSVYTMEKVIDKFKKICMPENQNYNEELDCWFYLILFYFKQQGYIIKEFPRLVKCPPLQRYEFVYGTVRDKIIREGKDENGTVKYDERRKLINSLTFEKISPYILLGDEIEQKFTEISNGDVSFQKMAKDEKLREINNLIENMLKQDGKFLKMDYEKICYDYIDDTKIRNYRKMTQCFRHATTECLNQRKKYSEEQKDFLIDFGILILKSIYILSKDN